MTNDGGPAHTPARPPRSRRGFADVDVFAVPCAGKYRLEVKVYGPSLMDRKVRRMLVGG